MRCDDVEYHANQEQLSAAEAASVDAPADGALLAILAWHWRERDTRRSIELAARALATPLAPAARMRAHLAEARALGLSHEIDAARTSLALAARSFDAGGAGPVLTADLALVGAELDRLVGDSAAAATRTAEALAVLDAAGLAQRAQRVRATMAWSDLRLRGLAAAAHWQAVFPDAELPDEPDLRALVLTYRAYAAWARADFQGVLRLSQAAVDAAEPCGMRPLQAVCNANIAGAMTLLGDLSGALEYHERSIHVAREAGLLLNLADSQNGYAETLIALERPERARQVLQLCAAINLSTPSHGRYGRHCKVEASLAHMVGDWAGVIAWCQRMLAAPQQSPATIARAYMLSGSARTRLGDGIGAQRDFERAIELGRAMNETHFLATVLREAGDLHRDLDIPRAPGVGRLDAQLAAYSEARALIAELPEALPETQLLVALARVHEERGELAQALALEREARRVQDQRQSRAVADREIALQMRESMQRADADARHSRDTASLLERIGSVGRQMNAEHDPQHVLATLLDSVEALVPCDSVAVYRLDAAGAMLELAAGRESAAPLAFYRLALDDAGSAAARVAREGLDVYVERDPGVPPVHGTRAMRSCIYASLAVAGRVVGALTVQAERPRAYGEREQLAVRALAAFGAVALANADAAQKLREAGEAKSMFFASMSHELRTPLNGILGFAQLLKMDRSLADRQRVRIDAIHRSGEHLLALINDILDISRLGAGRFELHAERCELAEVLELVGDIARVKADEKNLLFVLDAAPDLPARVDLDATRLRQVLINLLGNAVKFTAAGEIRLRVGARSVAPGRVGLGFEVSDTGVGMAPEVLGAIFEPFEQTGTAHSRRGGTGLGLAISRELVRLMGGEITVRSTPGVGSVFGFEIEVTGEGTADAPTGLPLPVVGYEGPRRRVLVVDDTPAARALLVGFLGLLGFEVAEAGNGVEALAVAARWTPDLVLMDHTMPEMGGVEATGRLRARRGLEQLPVISISAAAPEPVAEPAARADATLPKPVDLEVLRATAGRLLGLRWVSAG